KHISRCPTIAVFYEFNHVSTTKNSRRSVNPTSPGSFKIESSFRCYDLSAGFTVEGFYEFSKFRNDCSFTAALDESDGCFNFWCHAAFFEVSFIQVIP